MSIEAEVQGAIKLLQAGRADPRKTYNYLIARGYELLGNEQTGYFIVETKPSKLGRLFDGVCSLFIEVSDK